MTLKANGWPVWTLRARPARYPCQAACATPGPAHARSWRQRERPRGTFNGPSLNIGETSTGTNNRRNNHLLIEIKFHVLVYSITQKDHQWPRRVQKPIFNSGCLCYDSASSGATHETLALNQD